MQFTLTDNLFIIMFIFKLSVYNQVYQAVLLHQTENMRYKPEGRGFDSGWCHCNVSLT